MIIFVFLMGAILGSFYLVVATRLPKGEDILFSRSHCDHCHKELKWYNLIPIVSFLGQKGKCTYCGEKIALLNLTCELITGSCFALAYYFFGFSYNFWEGLVIISLTIIIFISDFKYMIILDSPLVVGVIVTFVLKLIYFGLNQTLYDILCGIALFCVMLLIEQIGQIIFKKEALGGGDIKFAFLIGFILKFRLGLIALILSTFLALPYSVASLYLIKNNEVPYGPFLAGSLAIIFFMMDKFQTLFSFLLHI